MLKRQWSVDIHRRGRWGFCNWRTTDLACVFTHSWFCVDDGWASNCSGWTMANKESCRVLLTGWYTNSSWEGHSRCCFAEQRPTRMKEGEEYQSYFFRSLWLNKRHVRLALGRLHVIILFSLQCTTQLWQNSWNQCEIAICKLRGLRSAFASPHLPGRSV